MGRASRPKPAKLAEKLLIIRKKLGSNLSQDDILKLLKLDDDIERDRISKYERGTLEPPLYVLLKYARLANVWLDALVDDEIDLPKEIPSKVKSEGIKPK